MKSVQTHCFLLIGLLAYCFSSASFADNKNETKIMAPHHTPLYEVAKHTESINMSNVPADIDYVEYYNSIPALKEGAQAVLQLGGLKQVREELLSVINEEDKRLAEKYMLFVRVNHAHHILKQGHKLVENKAESDDKGTFLSASPQHSDLHNTWGYAWTINNIGQVVTIEYSRDEAMRKASEDNQLLKLINKLLLAIKEKGYQKNIAIYSNLRESLPLKAGFSYEESTKAGEKFSLRRLVSSIESAKIKHRLVAGIPLIAVPGVNDGCEDVCAEIFTTDHCTSKQCKITPPLNYSIMFALKTNSSS